MNTPGEREKDAVTRVGKKACPRKVGREFEKGRGNRKKGVGNGDGAERKSTAGWVAQVSRGTRVGKNI